MKIAKIQIINKFANAPKTYILWNPNVILSVGSWRDIWIKAKDIAKPKRSVTKWKASEMTAIDPEI